MNKQFKPYVSAERILPEFSIPAVVLGILLSVIIGSANAYLGLRAGLTVTASIPAAVVSMGVLRVLLHRESVLENNIVQTIGSTGTSLASGAIFTMPAYFLWANEGVMKSPDMLTLTLLAVIGSLLGVLFMVPLRRALIVKEHNVLPYPEGTACAEVLLAGEKGGASAMPVFAGFGVAALVKFIVNGLKIIPETITAHISSLGTAVSLEAFPALIAVGYICGPKISARMLSGAILGWIVIIPLIVLFGADTILAPATATVSELFASGGPDAIWSQYLRYIGAGAVAAAGIISLVKSLPLIIKTFIGAMGGLKEAGETGTKRTDTDLNPHFIIIGIVVLVVLLAAIPIFSLGILGAILVAVFGFFFAAVSSRICGIVGSSNSPISGMTIATLLLSAGIMVAMGINGAEGMACAMAIGVVACIIAAVAGDTSQDLKTGFILGGTPWKQQIGAAIGAIAAALCIGAILTLLDNAWGFGSAELPAPQANLMKLIVEATLSGNLPWGLIFIGAAVAVAVEMFGISSLVVGIGLYLPFQTSATIMVGGIVKFIVERIRKKREEQESQTDSGLLFSSGLIAGDGILGMLLAVLTVTGIDKVIDLSGSFVLGDGSTLFVIVGVAACVYIFAHRKQKGTDTPQKTAGATANEQNTQNEQE